MTKTISILCVVFLLGCAEKETNSYLQEAEISLVAPRIETSSTIIDSSVILSAQLRLEGAAIYYTMDGTDPTRQSDRYQKAIVTAKEGLYKFRAFHKSWKPSAISEVKLYRKGFLPAAANWRTSAHSTYPGQGNSTLLNQKKASINFRDPQWVGFDTLAQATLTFNKKPFVKGLTIGYLVDTKSWIFPPSQITLYVNQKDTIIHPMDVLTEIELKKICEVYIPIKEKIESITIVVDNTQQLPEWHPGYGTKAWLFMDEWIFNK